MRQLGRIARRTQLIASRRPPRSKWRTPALAALTVALVLLAGGIGYAAAERAGLFAAGRDLALARTLSLTERAGMTVEEVYVQGRQRTSREALVEAAKINYRANILTADLIELKGRVEGLPWVRRAVVKRQLPSRLVIEVEEHQPLALWRRDPATVVLLASDGTALAVPDLRTHADLPVLAGRGAPKRAAGLFEVLASAPGLAERVTAAQLVNERRWNVVIDGAVVIRLPERGAALAWRDLARRDAEEDLLGLAVQAVDLRAQGRMILKLHPALVENAEREV